MTPHHDSTASPIGASHVGVLTCDEVKKNPRQQNIMTMFPHRQSASGCPLCAVCNAELRRKDGRPRYINARYCSKHCRDEASVRSGKTNRIRELLLDRDKGICAECGIHCEMIKDNLEKIDQWSYEVFYPTAMDPESSLRIVAKLAKRLYSVFKERAAPFGFRPYRHSWEAHHKVPVVEGGGGCDLEGFATHCIACHKHNTAELASRRTIS